MRLNKKTSLMSVLLAVLIFLSTTQIIQAQAYTWTVTKTIPYKSASGFDNIKHGVYNGYPYYDDSYIQVKMVSGVGNPYAEVTKVYIWWRSQCNYLYSFWQDTYLDWVRISVTLKVGSTYSTKHFYVWTSNDWYPWQITQLDTIYPSNLRIYGSGGVSVDVETKHRMVGEYPIEYRSVYTGFMSCGSIGWI